MKLIQTPSLITGAILGASLITLSAASNDSVLGGLNVFFPGTTVSSTEVNDNFTYLDAEVASLETRVVDLEGSSSSSEMIYFQNPSLTSDPRDGTNLTITVPDGYAYRLVSGWAYNTVNPDIKRFGSGSGNFAVVIDNLIPTGAGSSITKAPHDIMDQRPWSGQLSVPGVVFPPGCSMTFVNDSGYSFTNLNVCIEKITFVPVTQNQ